MSRSNNTEISSPCKRYYEWVGSKGCLRYFDKSKGEKGENVFVPLPFSFLVLDRLHTIRGYSDAAQSGFWSNEVRDLRDEQFTVRNKKGIVASGLYSNLAAVLNQGANYCQSVYIAVKNEKGELEICNLQIQGSAIGVWINVCKGKDIYKYAITISGATPAVKGATKYFTPVFKLNPTITEATEGKAQELDKELQEYLKSYFKRTGSAQRENIKETDVVVSNHVVDETEINTALMNEPVQLDVPVDDLPF
jgi:hypothetical protein